MLRYVFLVFLHIALASNLSGCAQAVMGAISAARASSKQAQKDANKKPVLTQLQTRQLQTRNYATRDTKKILQVALAVLQDEGFVVKNSDADMGLLSASKNLHEVDVDSVGSAFAKGFFGFVGSVSSHEFSTVEATVTVTSFGKEARVRLSVRLSSTESGGLSGSNIKYEAVTDPNFYQDFFAKLQKGIFIEQQGL